MRSLILLSTLALMACDQGATNATPPTSPSSTVPAASALREAGPATESSSAIAAPETGATEAARPMAAAIDRFNEDLYAKLRTEPGNLIYSPAGIAAALAMTSAGAKGATELEMSNVLHVPNNTAMAASQFSALLASWAQPAANGPVLEVVNRIWVHKDYALVPDFTKLTKEKYLAEAESLDFHASANAAQTINAWASESTHGKITSLVSSASVPPTTKLVLTNAVYFKGKWQTAFDKSTKDDTFTTDASHRVTVPMMNEMISIPYTEIGDAQIADLAYVGSPTRDLALTIVLPKAGKSLATVEHEMTAEGLTTWTKNETPTETRVSLPRFKVSHTFSLGLTLGAMGMPSAFTTKADFSGISTDAQGLFISDVVHEALIDVDEAGTEAAAATAVVAVAGAEASPTPPTVLKADHPFLFYLRDRTTGAILFAGRVTDPTKS